MKTEPMHYASISGGQFDADLQEAFLEAQDIAKKSNVKTEVSVNITIAPEDKNSGFGAIKYKLNVKRGARSSNVFQTQFDENGRIVFDSGSMKPVKPKETAQIDAFPAEATPTTETPARNVVPFKNGTGD